jgi:transcriptional regulator with XRE-family HTH domain
MPSIGDRIKERRTELGWTQDQLAQRANLSKGFLSDLENDKRGVGAETLHSIARALGTGVDELMTGGSTPKQASEIRVPASLSQFASAARLSFSEVMALLDMQRQIIAHRSNDRDDDLERVDWRRFYERVKEFL